MTLNAEGPVQILGQDTQGRVLVGPERREALLAEYDCSGMSAVKFAQYVGIKYSTLAYWNQSRRRRKRRQEQSLIKAGADAGPGKSNGSWVEAVLEHGSASGMPGAGLRIYFAGGAYCQIGNAAEAALAAQLLGQLRSMR